MFVVLARLLEPSDFGLAAIAVSAISVIEMVSAPGISRALIQHKDDIRPYLNAFWSLWMVRSFVIAALVFIFAPVVSWFFKDPHASYLTRWLAPIIFIRGLVNPETTLIFKNLNFYQKFLIDVPAQVALVLITISAAWLYPSPLALIWGQLASEITGVVMSYVVLDYRPRWQRDWSSLEKFTKFSTWNWGIIISQFFLDMADIFVIGRLLSSAILGFYSRAKNLGFIFYSLTRQLFFKVVFPLYAMIQDEKERCGKIFVISVEVLLMISVPGAVLCFAFTKPLVVFVFGEKWLPMVDPLKILFIAGLFRTFLELAATFLQGIGRADVHFRLTCFQLVPLVVLLPLLTLRHGMIGSSWAVLFSSLVAFLYALFEIFRQHDYRFMEHVRCQKFAFPFWDEKQ